MRRIRKSTCPADLLNGCFWQAAKEPTGIFRWLFSVIYSPAAPGILRPARRRGLLPPRWAGAWLRPRGADRRSHSYRTVCSTSRASEAYPRPRWPRRRWRRDSSAPPFQDTPSAPFSSQTRGGRSQTPYPSQTPRRSGRSYHFTTFYDKIPLEGGENVWENL